MMGASVVAIDPGAASLRYGFVLDLLKAANNEAELAAMRSRVQAGLA